MQENFSTIKTFLFATVVLLTSFMFCYIPIYLASFGKIKKHFQNISAFAAGLLLAVLLVDIVPHVVEGGCACSHKGHAHKPFEFKFHSLMAAGVVFIALLAIDTLFLHHDGCDSTIKKEHKHSCNKEDKKEEPHSHNEELNESPESLGLCNTSSIKNSKSSLQAMLFVGAISVHSFLEGLAIRQTKEWVSWYEVALLIHKILESVGISLSIQQTNFPKRLVFALFSIFSLCTPIAMFCSTFLKPKSLPFSLANGGALGSILFIVFVEMIPSLFHGHNSKKSVLKLVIFFAGFVVISFLIRLTHS